MPVFPMLFMEPRDSVKNFGVAIPLPPSPPHSHFQTAWSYMQLVPYPTVCAVKNQSHFPPACFYWMLVGNREGGVTLSDQLDATQTGKQ